MVNCKILCISHFVCIRISYENKYLIDKYSLLQTTLLVAYYWQKLFARSVLELFCNHFSKSCRKLIVDCVLSNFSGIQGSALEKVWAPLPSTGKDAQAPSAIFSPVSFDKPLSDRVVGLNGILGNRY